MIIYTDRHIISLTPGTCKQCGEELEAVEYVPAIGLQEVIGKLQMMIKMDEINKHFIETKTIEVTYDPEFNGWFARVVEWPGCMTQADTFQELFIMLQDAIEAWHDAAPF